MVSKRVSRWSLALVVIAVLVAVNVYQFLQPREIQQIATAPKQVPALQKVKASVQSAFLEWVFLVMDAGKERSIYATNGLDPEWVTISSRQVLAADIKDQVALGIKIGINVAGEVLIARSQGVPVKIVAGYLGEVTIKTYVKADGPIKTVKDLDGKKIGVSSLNSPSSRTSEYINNKFGIKAELVPLGNITNQVVALKLGKIDAFNSAEGAPLRLVDSGELRIVLRLAEVLPKPWASIVIFATEDLIDKNPDLVRSFVKATLETVKYLKENPSYSADLYIKKSNAPKDLADKTIGQMTWTPSGRGSGTDLVAAVADHWQYNKESGAIPPDVDVKIEDAVDVRFLP